MELRWADGGSECVGRFRVEAGDLKPIDDAGVTMSGRSLTFMLRVLPGSERHFLVSWR